MMSKCSPMLHLYQECVTKIFLSRFSFALVIGGTSGFILVVLPSGSSVFVYSEYRFLFRIISLSTWLGLVLVRSKERLPFLLVSSACQNWPAVLYSRLHKTMPSALIPTYIYPWVGQNTWDWDNTVSPTVMPLALCEKSPMENSPTKISIQSSLTLAPLPTEHQWLISCAAYSFGNPLFHPLYIFHSSLRV